MPIRIPDSLPARRVLEGESVFVMTEQRAAHQDIRPLRLIILNLMPLKIITETQLLRCLSSTPLQIEIELLQTSTYTSKNTPEQHLLSFYTTFDQIRSQRYDGMIITGAPVEHLPFEAVEYWPELCEILEWSRQNVYSTFHICWGAQAALYHRYRIAKHILLQKMFGVFEHKVLQPASPLLRGFDDTFYAPHSHHTGTEIADLLALDELEVLATSDEAGLYLAISRDGRSVYCVGHPEYDAETLALEYARDRERGADIQLPRHYFPQDDPQRTPRRIWRSHAYLLYSNWLNYYVYQTTPYDLRELS